MNILDLARRDTQHILTNGNDWAVDVTFTSKTGEAVTIKATASKHHLNVSGEGVAVNSLNAHIAVSEAALVAAGYTVRNAGGEVNLKEHTVTYASSTGTPRTYIIEEAFPDETLGLIVCILGEMDN